METSTDEEGENKRHITMMELPSLSKSELEQAKTYRGKDYRRVSFSYKDINLDADDDRSSQTSSNESDGSERTQRVLLHRKSFSFGGAEQKKIDLHPKISNNTSNVGLSLLKKMGWKENSGLGKNGDGIKEPIGLELQVKKDREGLNEYKKTLPEMKPNEQLWTSTNFISSDSKAWDGVFTNAEVSNWEELETDLNNTSHSNASLATKNNFARENNEHVEEEKSLQHLIAELRGCEDEVDYWFTTLYKQANMKDVPEEKRAAKLRSTLVKLRAAMTMLGV